MGFIISGQAAGNGGSIQFNGTNQWLTVPGGPFNLSSNNFTIEAWVYVTANGTNSILTLGIPMSRTYWSFAIGADRAIGWGSNDGNIAGWNWSHGWSSSPGVVPLNAWTHVAAVKSGGNFNIYVNGTSVLSLTNSTFRAGANGSDGSLYIGSYYGNVNNDGSVFRGNITNLRIVNGTAVYTSAFTPSTAPLTAITNTALLMTVPTAGGMLTDSSPNAQTVTNVNTAVYSSSSPLPVLTTGMAMSGTGSGMVISSYVPPPPSHRAIFGYGYSTGSIAITNLVSTTGVVATDTAGVGTGRQYLAAAGYGTDKGIFAFGGTGTNPDQVSMINLVSNTGVVATDTATAAWARFGVAGAGYGTDKAIVTGDGRFGANPLRVANLISNTGAVASNTNIVGAQKFYLAAAGYGGDKAIFGFGWSGGPTNLTNLVSNTGVVGNDVSGVGSARYALAAAGYGSDKAIFASGNISNLVSNTGVVATNTTIVATSRSGLAAAVYGVDTAIFGYGGSGSNLSMTNLVSNTGVVASDTTGVGTARSGLAAANYGFA